MDAAETRAAKEQFVRAMAAGSRWDEAAHATGLPMGRTTAYRLYQRYRVMGEAALIDGRHGHPAKMRPAVRGWLADYCRENPTLTNRVVRAAPASRGPQIASAAHQHSHRFAVDQRHRVNVACAFGVVPRHKARQAGFGLG